MENPIPKTQPERFSWVKERAKRLDFIRGEGGWISETLETLWENPEQFEDSGVLGTKPDGVDKSDYALFRLAFLAGTDYEAQFPRQATTTGEHERTASNTRENPDSLFDASRWWPGDTPSFRERAAAFLKAVVSPDYKHEMETSIAARPRSVTEDGMVWVDICKVVSVLHHEEHGTDRSTNLRVKTLDTTIANYSDVHAGAICPQLLPLTTDEVVTPPGGFDPDP